MCLYCGTFSEYAVMSVELKHNGKISIFWSKIFLYTKDAGIKLRCKDQSVRWMLQQTASKLSVQPKCVAKYFESSAVYSCVAVHIGCYADSIAPPYLPTVQTAWTWTDPELIESKCRLSLATKRQTQPRVRWHNCRTVTLCCCLSCPEQCASVSCDTQQASWPWTKPSTWYNWHRSAVPEHSYVAALRHCFGFDRISPHHSLMSTA